MADEYEYYAEFWGDKVVALARVSGSSYQRYDRESAAWVDSPELIHKFASGDDYDQITEDDANNIISEG